MDAADVAEVLTLIAALDPYGQREASRATIAAWSLVLEDEDLDLRTAMQAVKEFHHEEQGRPMAVADLVRIGREVAARERGREVHEAWLRRRAEERAEGEKRRAAIEAAGGPAPTRDRTADIHALIEQHRNWSVTGDLAVRRKQARWNPELKQRYEQALIDTARRDETPPEVGGDGSGAGTDGVESH